MTTRAVEATGLPAEDPRVPVRGDRSQQTPSAPVPEVPGPDSTTPGDAAGGAAAPDPGGAAAPPAVETPVAPGPVAEAPGPVAPAPGPVAEAPGPVAEAPGPVEDAPAPVPTPAPVIAAAPQAAAVPPGIPVPPTPPAAEAVPAPSEVAAPAPVAAPDEVPAAQAAPVASTARTTTTSAPRLTPATPPVKTAAKAPAATATTTAGATKAPVVRSGGAGSGSGPGTGDGTGATPRQPRRQNPEGRMALREHLTELRKRVVRAGLAIVLGAIAGWFLYDPVIEYLTAPLQTLRASGEDVQINFAAVASAFDLKLKASVWIGFIVSSPLWIYQLWAFITPGLTKKERRYAIGFVSTAVPLFLAGVFLASLFIPNAVGFFTSFTPDGGSNIIDAPTYLGFVMRTVLAFGLAFLLPVVLVGLNFAGLLAGKTVLKAWRWVLVLCMTFAAIATPTPDVTAMFTLAAPMLILFALAIGICLLSDRRKSRRNPQFGDVADDEASELADDEASGPIGRAAPLAERPAPVDDESTAR